MNIKVGSCEMIKNEPVDGDVETEKLDELFLYSETKNVGQVPGVVLGGIDSGDFALTINVAVDTTSNVGELGNPTQRWGEKDDNLMG